MWLAFTWFVSSALTEPFHATQVFYTPGIPGQDTVVSTGGTVTKTVQTWDMKGLADVNVYGTTMANPGLTMFVRDTMKDKGQDRVNIALDATSGLLSPSSGSPLTTAGVPATQSRPSTLHTQTNWIGGAGAA